MLLHTQAERGPVGLTGPIAIPVGCQRTRSYELVGGKGFEPNRPPKGERGYGPSADHPLVPPVWRQRQDSNPDPRALEARMLPLHHAAYVISCLDCRKDTPLL